MSKHKWLRTGHTISALEHDRWRKGVEEFRNRFTISIQGDPRVPAEETLRIAEFVEVALNAHADLVAALEAIIHEISTCGYPPLSTWPQILAALLKAKGES